MAALGENKESIYQFRSFVTSMPHFLSNTDVNMNRRLGGSPSLARPGVHPNQRHVAVGTDNEDLAEHVLLCLDTNIINQSMEANPIVGRTTIPQAVQDTHWIGDTLLVCVGKKEGPSQMLLYNIDVDGDHEFKLKDDTVTTEQTVREIAVNTIERSQIAFGGYDQNISIIDFEHGTAPKSVFETGGDISSVRWEPYHHNRLVSCTTNEGQLKIFDVQGSKNEPAWMYQTDIRTHLNLYTHCQTSEFQILLGYEDNFIEAIDIRKNSATLGCFMTGATDPYCYMVGDLHYRESSGYLLATGMADFSVYKHFRSGADKGVCKLWCHATGSTNRDRNDGNVVRHGVFLNDSWVVTTQEGSLGLYRVE